MAAKASTRDQLYLKSNLKAATTAVQINSAGFKIIELEFGFLRVYNQRNQVQEQIVVGVLRQKLTQLSSEYFFFSCSLQSLSLEKTRFAQLFLAPCLLYLLCHLGTARDGSSSKLFSSLCSSYKLSAVLSEHLNNCAAQQGSE